MTIRFLAGAALAVSVAACGSSGDTGALLIESAQACGAVCAAHPGIGSIAYEAGGGSPLLFGGKVSVDCECADAGRGALAPARADRIHRPERRLD